MNGAAWYNEKDPKAAAVLRELIRRGEIAPGDVDERDIRDVAPAELVGYAQRHFFAGFGIWSRAMRRAGWPDRRPAVTISCPCQPFSGAGKGEGFADERHLWPAGYWHICLGAPVPVFGEQVSSEDGLAWLDVVSADLEAAHYTVGPLDLCAAGFGSPQIRQRLYWLAYPDARRCEQYDERERGLRILDPSLTTDGMGDTQRPRPQERELHRRISGAALGGDARQVAQCGGDPRGMGHAEGQRGGSFIGESGTGNRYEGETGGPGVSRRLGHARGQRSSELGRRRHQSEGSAATGLSRWVADADGGDARAEGQQRGGEHGLLAGSRGADGLDDASGLGRGESWNRNHGADERLQPSTAGTYDRPGPTNGFWAGPDWILCRPEPEYPQGRWRPVEPGTFPLAHGAAQRVGRLRGYGNGLVEPQAKEFIEAAIPLIPEVFMQIQQEASHGN